MKEKIPAGLNDGEDENRQLVLADFFYFARPDASGANMQTNMSSMRPHCLYILQIWLGDFFCSIVRMAHLIAAQLTFSTDLTRTRHSNPP